MNSFQGYIGEGELICEVCDHDGLEEYPEHEESDIPCNCSYCHRPINSGLTNDGVKYVYESVRQALSEGLNTRSEFRWTYGYYIGMGVHASLRDHAELLLEHNPDKRMKRVVEYYLYYTKDMP